MTDRLPKLETYLARCEARGERAVTRTGEERERVGFGISAGRPKTLQSKRSEPTLRRQASRMSTSERGSMIATSLRFDGVEANELNKRSEASLSRKTSRTLKERTTPASVKSHSVTEERLGPGGGEVSPTKRAESRLGRRVEGPIFVDTTKSKLTVRVAGNDFQLISKSGRPEIDIRRENEHLALEREKLALDAERLELDRAQLVLDRKRLELDRERLRVTHCMNQLNHTYSHDNVLFRREF
ncbi:hypothetical protein B0H16DRAFT_1504895 [Mycena metata]|uniref:Uncharacterized protein n=1 Tax=Mycena metata TaxID=1033252 RepID=A0AAD7NVW4_9AGAR|nr:hypothetical protein B0H16DRAFT_1504895 [Mycena metata]